MNTLQRIKITLMVAKMALRAIAQSWNDSAKLPRGARGSLTYKLQLDIE
jgi:hypothetical protein